MAREINQNKDRTKDNFLFISFSLLYIDLSCLIFVLLYNVSSKAMSQVKPGMWKLNWSDQSGNKTQW